MSDPYTIVSVGLQDGRQRLEALSTNAVNSALPGYRRLLPPSRTFADALAEPDIGTSQSVAPSTARVDLRIGGITVTDRALDVAIEGDAHFFAVSDGATTWLTRAGSFRLDDAGWLVGERGLRVQGTGGDIHLDGVDVEIQRDGRIVRDGMVVAALQLFKPADRVSLAPAGGALLTAGALEPVDATAVHVRGAALESSNAGAATEMIDLLTLTRQFESLVRVAQSYDELVGRTIQKLGDV